MSPVRAPVDLRTLPAIRAEVERLARAYHDAMVRSIKAAHYGSYAQSLIDALPSAWVTQAAHLDLLCDMTRPASRDAVVRLVAAKLGIECGATAPSLFRLDDPEPCWWIDCIHGDDRDDESRAAFLSTQATFGHVTFPVVFVPSISTITDPAEALRLIALHVLRSPDV